jgi:hypothetical protein
VASELAFVGQEGVAGGDGSVSAKAGLTNGHLTMTDLCAVPHILQAVYTNTLFASHTRILQILISESQIRQNSVTYLDIFNSSRSSVSPHWSSVLFLMSAL